LIGSIKNGLLETLLNSIDQRFCEVEGKVLFVSPEHGETHKDAIERAMEGRRLPPKFISVIDIGPEPEIPETVEPAGDTAAIDKEIARIERELLKNGYTREQLDQAIGNLEKNP
jgi:hypothetical protein